MLLRRTIFTLVFFVALTASLTAATLTPFDVMRMRFVTSAVISPDGSKIAYTVAVPRNPLEGEDGPMFAELHVVDRAGNSQPFITGEVNVAQVRWMPDSRSISFIAKRGKDEFRSLYVINTSGGEARRLIAHDSDIADYSWSPDGKRVALLANDAESKKNKDLKKKGFSQIIVEEAARPSRIWIASAETGAKPRLLAAVEGSASDVQWSPVGSRIAVALAPTSLVDESYTSRRVTVVDADSGQIVGRVQNPGKLGNLAWSTDGRTVAFISASSEHDSAAGRLVVASATGGAMREILPKYQGHATDVAWRDANTVIYAGDEGVYTTIGEVRADGTTRRTILEGSMSIGSIDLSRDAKSAALLVDSPSHPSEVYLWTAGAAQPKRLTNNNPWLASVELAKQEVVRYRARDGVEIDGMLVRPLGEVRGRRYPLIINVHGGPESHYRNGWLTSYSSPGQVAAARGFAVFYPNYRGSTGRGVEFTNLSHGDPAGKEFDDLVDAITHFVGSGLADKAKVGITGGSYGGYASAWGATKLTEHFAASVMFVGISNLASKWGTTDIPNEEVLVHAGQHPSDNWQFHLERSPVYYAKQSRTPTLILHGNADPRVHPGQSLDLYRHLKQFGKAPVRLVLYPGEGHGNARAASRLDYNLRMMQWFEHYLQGSGGKPPAYDISYELPQPATGTMAAPSDAPKQEPQKQEELKKKPDPTKPE